MVKCSFHGCDIVICGCDQIQRKPLEEPRAAIGPREGQGPMELPAVGGDRLDCSIATFERRALVALAEEQSKLAPNNRLIALYCDAVRLAREYSSMMNAPSVPERTKSEKALEGKDASERNALSLQIALEALDKQYHALLDEAFDEAQKLKVQGDTHGDNFYRGRETGLIAFDIALTPLKELIRSIPVLQSAEAASA